MQRRIELEAPVLNGEKILLTGPAGRIAFGLARSLAADNEVWGIVTGFILEHCRKAKAALVMSTLSVRMGWREGFARLVSDAFPDRVHNGMSP